MNNPNPFVPKGSLLEQQNKRRTHMKFGVLCVLSVSVASLMIMLIQGCKKADTQSGDTGITTPPPDTGATNAEITPPPTDISNQTPVLPPTNIATITPTVIPTSNPVVTPPALPVTQLPPTTDAGGEYTVVKGDSLAKIAKKNGVTLKALEAANPAVKPTKLKLGQKLVLPAGKTVADSTATPTATGTTDTAEESYTVKSGDTLTKIAKAHHVKVKALMAANGLTTTQIKVGKKLKIPSKAEAPVAAVPAEPAPATDTSTQAPPLPQVNSAPVVTTPPAPGQH